MPGDAPTWAAVILAGGRGSRLGGADKAALRLGGVPLVDRLLSALADAAAVVVVGDHPPTSAAALVRVSVVRENPPFGGPVAATAAGLDELSRLEESARVPGHPDAVALLAVDMPHAAAALPLLLDAWPSSAEAGQEADGVIAVDGAGRRQSLLALYRTDRLREAVAGIVRERGGVEGSSMRLLLAGLDLREVPVPDLAAADVDTPEDAARLGIELRKAADAAGRGEAGHEEGTPR
ncbi:MAG TPA: NTP transferase domain-containing protein [Naasia sp.]|jgi:molybdopterin-guanine dinucleotide biosynthesis protein A